MSEDSNSSSSNTDRTPTKVLSFKPPRDLTLGAGNVKANKKVFLPNLNVVRNKNNKSNTTNKKENNKDGNKFKKDRFIKDTKNRSSNIVKSTGVFSEGLAASERHNSSRASYATRGDTDGAPTTLTKPFIKLKDSYKIDKALEEEKLKKLTNNAYDTDEETSIKTIDLKEAPIKLPITDGGNLFTTTRKLSVLTMKEPVIKQEKLESEDVGYEDISLKKPSIPDVKSDTYESMDILNILRSDTPKMLLLQLPDNLPGRGPDEETNRSGSSQAGDQPVENKCLPSDLEEGRIGKILIHKSGKIKMKLGETLFDISMGTQPCFKQDIMSIAMNHEEKTASMINLGSVEKKLTIVPDWDVLFKDVCV